MTWTVSTAMRSKLAREGRVTHPGMRGARAERSDAARAASGAWLWLAGKGVRAGRLVAALPGTSREQFVDPLHASPHQLFDHHALESLWVGRKLVVVR